MNYSKSIIDRDIPGYSVGKSDRKKKKDARGNFAGNFLPLLIMVLTLAFFQGSIYAQSGNYQQPNNENILYTNGFKCQLSYTGSFRDFKVPADAAGKFLFFKARGGDGGRINYSTNNNVAKGGQGAIVSSYFKIGSGVNEIPVGSTIRIIIGGQGDGYTNHGQTTHHGAGGGGGTGILFLPPTITPANSNATDWTLLMVAGGGGGGWGSFYYYNSDGQPGNNGEEATEPSEMWYTQCNNYSQSKGWGGGTISNGNYFIGGGGAGYQMINDVAPGCVDAGQHANQPIGNSLIANQNKGGGYGGFQLVNGKMQPTGHQGGTPDKGNNGGFGFGSGAGGINTPKVWGGGGGGYSGGYKRGGGGSYVNSTYAIPGSVGKLKNGVTGSPINGNVVYQFTGTSPVSRSFFDHAKPSGTNEVLLHLGDYKLSWQGDGNLVLYDGFTARWATYTNGKGATECAFQGDGNLVIYAGKQAIWASGTDAGNHDGKGGKKLVLTPSGTLFIVNADNQLMWAVN
jgi:hypothetical protein